MKMRWTVIVLFTFLSAGSVEMNAQWKQRESGIDSTVTDIVMLDSSTAFAVSRGRSILKTTDKGETWLDLTAPLSFVMPWNAVSFYDPANGIAVGDHGSVFNIVGGSSHFSRDIINGQNCFSALHLSAANIYVGADSGWIYHSLDSGRTWSSEKISEWPVRSLFTYRGPTTGTIPVYALTSKSLCAKTEFPPTQWDEQILPQFKALGCEAFHGDYSAGGGAGYIVGVGGDFTDSPIILRKALSDTSWNAVPSGIPCGGGLYGVSAPSENTVYACGDMGAVVKSTDGGDSWVNCSTMQTQIEDPNLRAIYFFDERYGFAAGEKGNIFYTASGGLAGIERRLPPAAEDFSLEQNYPNPFNPSTVIRFAVRSAGFVCLKVYDVLGREVKTLVKYERKSPGTYSVRWDGTGIHGAPVSSGVYLYRLSTPTGELSRKAVVIR